MPGFFYFDILPNVYKIKLLAKYDVIFKKNSEKNYLKIQCKTPKEFKVNYSGIVTVTQAKSHALSELMRTESLPKM